MSNTNIPSRWEGERLPAAYERNSGSDACADCYTPLLEVLLPIRSERRTDRFTHSWVSVCVSCDAWASDPSDFVALPAPSPSEVLGPETLARFEPLECAPPIRCVSFEWRRHENCGEPLSFVAHGRVGVLPDVDFSGAVLCRRCDVFTTPPRRDSDPVGRPTSLRVPFETLHHVVCYEHAGRIHGNPQLERERHELESGHGSMHWPTMDFAPERTDAEAMADRRRAFRSFVLMAKRTGSTHFVCGRPTYACAFDYGVFTPWWYQRDDDQVLPFDVEFCPTCDRWLSGNAPRHYSPKGIPVAMWVVTY